MEVSQENNIFGGIAQKRGLGQFADLTQGLTKKSGVVFLSWGGGGLVPQFTLWVLFSQASNKHIKRQER